MATITKTAPEGSNFAPLLCIQLMKQKPAKFAGRELAFVICYFQLFGCTPDKNAGLLALEFRTRVVNLINKVEKIGALLKEKVQERQTNEKQKLEEEYDKARNFEETNEIRAFKIYKKLAPLGIIRAQYRLGFFYRTGKGGWKDNIEALYWHQKAAKQGDCLSQTKLGSFYEKPLLGLERNLKRAVFWYQKAANKGFARAQHKLGRCYLNGQGVKEDKTKAVSLYQSAADQGHCKARHDLGICYYYGKGVKQDQIKAFELFKKAADQASFIAQSNLGVCYFEGDGVTQDLAKAVKFFKRAAEGGFSAAQHNLGVCYFMGKGVGEDKNEAKTWFQKSKINGNSNEVIMSIRRL